MNWPIFLSVFCALLLMWLIDRYVKACREHKIYCLKNETKYRIMVEIEELSGRNDPTYREQMDYWRKLSKAWIPSYPQEPDVIPGETLDDEIQYWRRELSEWKTKKLLAGA